MTTWHDTIENDLLSIISRKPGKLWWALVCIALLGLFVGTWAMYQTLFYGIGVWGVNNGIAWGTAITNFVWWIGIAHAGTFISAILLLFRQPWRMAVNRSAESMTIVAIACAGVFPVIHLGRIVYAHYLIPIPTQSSLWVNFNSPLVWDIFAISTYLVISLLFWYVGLVPDFALLAQKAKAGFRKKLYKIVSLGWRNTLNHWELHHTTLYYMAAIAAPLVLSVHSVVSNDFAVTPTPGWHSTIFPPYFVAGAIFSGFAMTLTLIILMRKVFKLHDYFTVDVVESINKIILATGALVALAYGIEIFTTLTSDNPYEIALLKEKLAGRFSFSFYTMLVCNVLVPQVLWVKGFRRNFRVSFLVSILINIGMWAERFVIVINSLEFSNLPARDGHYAMSLVEIGLLIGSCSLFVLFFLLFTRFSPLISINEMKAWKGKGHVLAESEPVSHVSIGRYAAIYPNAELLEKGMEAFRAKGQPIEVFAPNYICSNQIHHSRVPIAGLVGGIVGCSLAIAFQYWVMVVNNPLLYGGKPFYAFPSFIPVVFEFTVLCAGVAMFVAFLWRLNSLKSKHLPPSSVLDNSFAILFKDTNTLILFDEVKQTGATLITLYDSE